MDGREILKDFGISTNGAVRINRGDWKTEKEECPRLTSSSNCFMGIDELFQ